MKFGEAVVIPDVRPGLPGVAVSVEEDVVTIQRPGSPPAYVSYEDFEAAMAALL